MPAQTKHSAIHWPDQVLGKRRSRQIREAHNALYNDYHDVLVALHAMVAATKAIPTPATHDGIALATARARGRSLVEQLYQ